MMIERPVSFDRFFRMRCEECSSSSHLTPENYVGTTEAMMTCTNCGANFNFGPRVIQVATMEDPAMNTLLLPQLIWYHTTTDPKWPQTSKPVDEVEIHHLRERVRMPDEEAKKYRRHHDNQALHLGTYEAAIDSMLRRMNEQGDQDSSFYLYRVRLRSDSILEEKLRDENKDIAAKITTFDLAKLKADGIRYLNAHEAIGSISLAVLRGAIESTQSTPVPIRALIDDPDDETLTQLRTLRKAVHATMSLHANDPLTPLEKLKHQRAQKGGRQSIRMPPLEVYKDIKSMETWATDRYLNGLSTVTKDNFVNSLGSPKPGDGFDQDSVWLEKFRSLAALLTRPTEVHQVLDSKPWQPIRQT